MLSLTLKLAPKCLCSNKLGLAFDQRPRRLRDSRRRRRRKITGRETDGEVSQMFHSPRFREDGMQDDLGGSAGRCLWSNICNTKQTRLDLSQGPLLSRCLYPDPQTDPVEQSWITVIQRDSKLLNLPQY